MAAGPDSLAYIIYTSGSTGMPKGVAVPHRGVVRLVNRPNYVDITSKDVFLQLASIAFDASIFEIWGALLNGARLVVFPPHFPSLTELKRTLREEKITVLWLTAGLFHQMVDSGLEGLADLRYLLAGGEALSVAHVRRAVRVLAPAVLVNGYGPTENTTFTCCYRVPADWPGGGSVPIGQPINQTQVLVLNQNMEPVPVGMPGELYTGGDGLARGYWQRPELTAEKFVASPFAPGKRLYRTGDLVRRLPDGNLEFLGRLDEQVKIRGFRVEPGEIETAMLEHEAVRQAVVVARPDTSGANHLVAYFVPQPGAQPGPSALREFLQSKLPPHLIPSHFIALATLPLTPNGKVDRRALPEPNYGQPPEAFVAPANSTEEKLAGIWSEVLGYAPVSTRANFFHLGGHSLLATQIVSRITTQFDVELPVRAVFETPTIAGLAAVIECAGARVGRSPGPRIGRELSADPTELLRHLDELTDAQVEALLSGEESKDLLS